MLGGMDKILSGLLQYTVFPNDEASGEGDKKKKKRKTEEEESSNMSH